MKPQRLASWLLPLFAFAHDASGEAKAEPTADIMHSVQATNGPDCVMQALRYVTEKQPGIIKEINLGADFSVMCLKDGEFIGAAKIKPKIGTKGGILITFTPL